MAMAHTLDCRPVRLGALHWLALHALVLWPHGVYLVQRALDGSDDPLGLIALLAAAALVASQRQRLRLTPDLPWLATALGLALIANGAWWAGAPSLVSALLAALSLAGALMAWWPRGRAKAPLLGLVVLALPWLATLQFYLGWPLRVLTAQLSAWALQLAGFAAERSGASMVVNGQLVIVDAPCSGVQMAWFAYFTACVCAAAVAAADRAFVRRVPLVGAAVLLGNVLRNSVLVAFESRPQGLAAAWHETIGLAVLAVVCVSVWALVQPRASLRHA
jgi:exosortase/archaeosortase family protein